MCKLISPVADAKTIGYFRITLGPFFKMRPGAKPFW